MLNFSLRLFPLVASAMAMNGVQGAIVTTEHLGIELVGERAALVPGTTAWLGLHIRHEPLWHTYWINPGDSGLPTRVSWTLPAGFKAGEIVWPAPKRFAVDGLANFGYDGDVLLPVALDIPGDATPGSTVRIAAEVRWLVCHEECIPGKANIALDLPILASVPIAASAANVPRDTSFGATRAALPQDGAWKADARLVGDNIEVQVRGADLTTGFGLDAFAEQPKIVSNAVPRVSQRNGIAVLEFAKSDYFTSAPSALDLVITRKGMRALHVHAAFAPGAPVSASP